MPLSIACIILIIQIFFHGTEPMFKLNIIGLKMIGFKEGLQYGIVIVSKVIGAVMLIMLLTMTTPIYKLLTAGLWLKIPYTFIEIAIFTYRYIFVLLQTAITIRDAQTVRLGYTNWYKGLRSWGELAGATIIKAYNQTISTHEAMISRGYYGKMNIEDKKDFDLYDYLAAIGLSMILIIMFYISRI
jgi:cobalt/nickel transport system permease protein